MKTVFINSFPPPQFYETDNAIEKIKYLGDNTGNLLYVHSLRKQVNYSEERWLNDWDYLNQKDFKAGIMPCSNILRPHCDAAEIWAPLIKKCKFPITLCGLGAQSFINVLTPKEVVSALPKERVNAFKTIGECCVSLGIRGEFTAECLELMGIKNYRIIGCPSFYNNPNGVFLEPSNKNEEQHIAINIQPFRSASGHALELGKKYDAYRIIQCEDELAIPESNIGVSKERFDCAYRNLELSEYEDYLWKSAKVFYDADEWQEFLRKKVSFSFGMRFHGNMFAFLSGVPSLWITHDSRTRELCDTLKLPSVSMEDFSNIEDICELKEYCNYKKTKEYSGRLYEEYVAYLTENRIDHNFII